MKISGLLLTSRFSLSSDELVSSIEKYFLTTMAKMNDTVGTKQLYDLFVRDSFGNRKDLV